MVEVVKRSRNSGNLRRAYEIRTLSILFLDIDNFKKLNDTYGHDIGDKALKLVAKTLKDNVRQLDIVGRLGGEEFLVGFPATNLESSIKIAEDIRKEIANINLRLRAKKIPLTASIGVYEQIDEQKLEELIKVVDKLMYKAKTTGKNKVAHPPL